MRLHDDEIAIDEATVRSLLAEQRPEWAGLAVTRAGAGTDNVMYRLGADLLVRLPRTPGGRGAVEKENRWLPRLGPRLPYAVPEPVHTGTPGAAFPLPWSVLRWIDGAEAGTDTVGDWAAFGRQLASFVRAFHSQDLLGASRGVGLDSYRGGSLKPCDAWVTPAFAALRDLGGSGLDVDALERLWHAGLALPDPTGPLVWLHGDLKPTNLLVRDGALCAVIDFGTLAVGFPDAEHAPVWDLPAPARHAYRAALGLDEHTWVRARAWAIGIAATGVPYYWESFPAFAHECLARLRTVLAETDTGRGRGGGTGTGAGTGANSGPTGGR